jgi:hypothetical protein
MAEKPTVDIVSSCGPAASDGQILFPKGSAPPKKRVLVWLAEGGEDKGIVLSPGLRGDHGTAACVSAATFATLSKGDSITVSYRELSLLGVLRRDDPLTLQLVIVLLSFAGAALSAYATWIKNSAEPSGFASDTAVIVFIIAMALAATKLVKEYREV